MSGPSLWQRILQLPDRLHAAVVGKGFNTAVPTGFTAYVGGGGPGGWASNHFTESKLVTGWAFTAIRAIARTCAKSVPQVHIIGRSARRRLDRAVKAHRKGLLSTEVLHHIKASVVSSQSGDDAMPAPSDDPLLRLLKRPNKWMTKAQFLFQHAQQASATGTTLIWTRRNGWGEFDRRGVPTQIYIIPTGVTYPVPPEPSQFPNGAYRVMPVGAFAGMRVDEDPFGDTSWTNLMITGGIIDGREMRPIRWPHPIFLTDGLSPMAAGELWVDIANQLDRATWHGMRNTLRPGYIFQMATGFEEPTKGESQRFDREIESRLMGLENVGRHMRLPKGVEIADSDRSVKELDYVNGRKAIGENVGSLWAVPPIAQGYQDPGAYAAYFAALLVHNEQACEPVLQLLADDLQDELAPAYGPDGGEREIKLPCPPVNDMQQRETELANRAQSGAITFNEYRKAIGMPPYPKRLGDLPVGSPIGQIMARELGIELEEALPNANNGQQTPNTSSRQRQNDGEPGASKPNKMSGDTARNPGASDKPTARMGPASDTGGAVRDKRTSRRDGQGEPLRRQKSIEDEFHVPIWLRPDSLLFGETPLNGLNGTH